MADTRKKMTRPLAIADLLATAFTGKPAGRRLEEGEIWLIWNAAVGKQIAAKAYPVSFRDGILTVAVSSAPWMQQLTFLKQGMIDKLNTRLGAELVRDIYLKAGISQASPTPPGTPKKACRRLTAEESRHIREQTADICDPELREAFARVLTRDLETKSR